MRYAALTKGYNIEDLAKNSTFEEVYFLLLYEKLPTTSELEEFKIKIHNNRWIPAYVQDVLERIPKEAHPMVSLEL